MAKNIQKSISKLLKADGRLQKYLVQIVGQVNDKTVPKFIQSLKAKIAYPLDWDGFFKILILLNNVIVNQQIALKQASLLLGTMNLKMMENSELHVMLINELLVPYHFYLQKRCSIGDLNAKDQSQAKCYSLLNLINIGASFSKMIFRLARYYSSILKYAEDFNIVWAADIAETYYWMIKCLALQKSQSFIQSFKAELQRVHESLYNVFYNCYYHKHLTKFIPRWLKTENQNPESPNQKHTERKQLQNAERIQLQNAEKKWLQKTAASKNKSNNSIEVSSNEANSAQMDKAVFINQFQIHLQQFNQERQSQLREFQQLTCQFQQLSLNILNRERKSQLTL